MPTVGDAFLLMVGAVAAFAMLGAIVRIGRTAPFDPSHGARQRVVMIHAFAVGAALGSATLVARIPSGIAWPLSAYTATATYLAAARLELVLAEAR